MSSRIGFGGGFQVGKGRGRKNKGGSGNHLATNFDSSANELEGGFWDEGINTELNKTQNQLENLWIEKDELNLSERFKENSNENYERKFNCFEYRKGNHSDSKNSKSCPKKNFKSFNDADYYEYGDGDHKHDDFPISVSSASISELTKFGQDQTREGCRNFDLNVKFVCYKCNKEGHMAKDCPEKCSDDKPRPPPYIPPEMTEIFETTIPTGINFSKYDDIPIEVTGENAPPPMNTFEEAGLLSTLSHNLKRLNYVKPTPVQKYSIPIILAKRDLMACAQTGSGKTAAFLIPILQTLLQSPDLPNPSCYDIQEPWALILCPTRELAIQTYYEAKKFSSGSIIKIVVIYGGTSINHQLSMLSAGCHILVATPGRLMDFVARNKVSFSQIRYLVFDEADKMLDMGFLQEMQKLVQNPKMTAKGERQTLMYSATFPVDIQNLAKEFLDNWIFLAVGIVGGANTDIEQTFHQVSQFKKRQKLLNILQQSTMDRTLIFVETKRTADFIASFLSQTGYASTSIHGDRFQNQREEALGDFKTGKRPILVATAVASHGLDINDINHVINYDLPETIEEYVHRIGRTGRMGNLGKATSFYDPNIDQRIVNKLIKVLKDSKQIVPDWLIAFDTESQDVLRNSEGICIQNDDIWM